LAKEFALTAPGSRLDRPLPLYLLGEFRNEGKGAERTITLKLRAERGGKVVGTPETLSLKGDAAPAAVRKWAGGVLNTLAKDNAPRPPADPKAEAKVLNERAKENARLGNRKEQLALLECSLLVDPQQPECHAQAILMLANFKHEVVPGGPASLGALVEGAQYHLRILSHIEAFADKGGNFNLYGPRNNTLPLIFAINPGSTHFLSNGRGTPTAEMQAFFNEVIKEDRRVTPRILEIANLQAYNERSHRPYNTPRLAPADLAKIPFTPTPKVAPKTPRAGLMPPEAQLPKAVPPPGYDPYVRPDLELNRIAFTPIALTVPGPGYPWPLRPRGLAQAGPNVELIWDAQNLYLMRKKGTLELLSKCSNLNTKYTVTYDGRYAWVICFRPNSS